MPINFLKVPIVSEGARNSVSLAPDCSMSLAVGHKQRLASSEHSGHEEWLADLQEQGRPRLHSESIREFVGGHSSQELLFPNDWVQQPDAFTHDPLHNVRMKQPSSCSLLSQSSCKYSCLHGYVNLFLSYISL